MKKPFIIGLGTGRCGTMSLAHLLNFQAGIKIQHEYKSNPLPWVFSKEAIKDKLTQLSELNGDIAFYYLNYVEYIAKHQPSTRFVCLKRDKHEVIDSYLRKTEGRNHWCEHDGLIWTKDTKWDKAYPKFKTNSKIDALSRYYNLYYQKINQLKRNPKIQIKLFNISDLNSEEGVESILIFCKLLKPDMVLRHSIKLNVDTR